MQATQPSIATALANHSQRVAMRIEEVHAVRDPGRSLRHPENVRAQLFSDLVYELEVLGNAIDTKTPALFEEYVCWLSNLRAAHQVAGDDLAPQLACVCDVLCAAYPASERVVTDYVRSASAEIGRDYEEPGGCPALGHAARHYLALVLAGERAKAVAFVNDSLDQGTSVADVYLDIIAAAQREIGRLWQANRLSVAQEHYATGVAQLVLAQLYPRVMHASQGGPRLVATCATGELHEMGARMVTDFFEMDGWDTTYLGANTPTESLLQLLHRPVPDVLALSATNSFQVSAVAATIEAARADPALSNLKILVGGRPFRISNDLWKRIGADASAPDALSAVRRGRELLTRN